MVYIYNEKEKDRKTSSIEEATNKYVINVANFIYKIYLVNKVDEKKCLQKRTHKNIKSSTEKYIHMSEPKIICW